MQSFLNADNKVAYKEKTVVENTLSEDLRKIIDYPYTWEKLKQLFLDLK